MALELAVTTAICTWNRSDFLGTTISSLEQLEVPADIHWEVLIVNNGCTDDTDQVVRQFSDRLPIRLLHEKQQGLSNARNCAIDAAKGDYILWTDDDVIVDPSWLVAYANAFRTWPHAALFDGPIKLKLLGSPPPWLPEMLGDESLASVYAHRDLSNTPIRLDLTIAIPYGPNLCIRTREQRKYRYNPYLGRHGNQQVRGEETAVVRAIIDLGAEGWWVPDAIVHHVIAEHLQTQAHLRRYFMGLGRSYVRREDPSRRLAFSGALRLLLSTLKSELRFRMSQLTQPPKIWLEDLRTASIRWGRLFEFLKFTL